MTPQKQLFRHRPDDGVIGDCWRTCIACLLDKAPADVPHFVQHCWNDSAQANANLRAWLAPLGLGFVEIAFGGNDLQSVLSCIGSLNPNTFYLLGGNSATGCGHSVIACNDRIVWDPSLNDSGIVGPMGDGHYWVTFLVPSLIVNGVAP